MARDPKPPFEPIPPPEAAGDRSDKTLPPLASGDGILRAALFAVGFGVLLPVVNPFLTFFHDRAAKVVGSPAAWVLLIAGWFLVLFLPLWLARRSSMAIVAAMASVVLATMAFPPLEISWMAYLAPVPLVVMALRNRSRAGVFGAGYVGGLLFFGINVYWLIPFSVIGYAAAMLYLALYWAVFAWALRRVVEATRLPAVVVAPPLWVALEFTRGWVPLLGFPWLFLGHSQYDNLTLIQSADLVGAYGASFLVMATGALAADLLTRPLFVPRVAGGRPRPAAVVVISIGGVGLLWAGNAWYGAERLAETEPGPKLAVAAAQTNVPQEIKLAARHADAVAAERKMIEELDALTTRAADAAAREGLSLDLMVWPETMVPGFLNPGFLEDDLPPKINSEDTRNFFEEKQQRCRRYWRWIQSVAQTLDAPVLFGANTGIVHRDPISWGGNWLVNIERANAALLMRPATEPYAIAGVYTKSHLVPFGEYVPFKMSAPWAYRFLHKFTPYPGPYSLTHGKRFQPPFELPDAVPGRTVRFQTPICYEDAFAYRIRDMVRPDAEGAKGADFIVNISNDGWFTGTTEHVQHLNLCAFRAVENRVPVVRSVNTGVSALVASTGAIRRQVRDPETGSRRGVEGFVVGRIALDDRLTTYTVAGDVFALGCIGASVVLLLAATIVLIRKRKPEGPTT